MTATRNPFKQSNTFYIVILVCLNIAYVSIEIYKSSVSEPLLGRTGITQAEFSKLETISHYALFFENAFLIVSIIWAVLMFSKNYMPSLKGSIFIHLSLLIVLFMLNCALAWIFNAPIGNVTQLLLGPLVLVFGALFYFLLNHSLSKIKRYKT